MFQNDPVEVSLARSRRDVNPRQLHLFVWVHVLLDGVCMCCCYYSFCSFCPRLWMYFLSICVVSCLLSKIFNMFSLIFYLGSDYQFAALGRHFVSPFYLYLSRVVAGGFQSQFERCLPKTRNACFVLFVYVVAAGVIFSCVLFYCVLLSVGEPVFV